MSESDYFASANANAAATSPRSPKRRRLSRGGCDDEAVAGPSDLSSPPPAPPRLIIALDLDAFYVAASRIRDPSLVGLPIGIKQKGILATCSYEARAVGVKKLGTIKDSLRKCPDLILVNGEDLSYFRKLSHRVWKLVRGIVWGGKVEKLGLDELFCDVTEMVDANVCGGADESGWFRLTHDDDAAGDDADARGFSFEPSSRASLGHVIPNAEGLSPRLRFASHLAAHLRSRIHEQIGLTASAGIAHNKLLAKLVCAKFKPAQQTVFAPHNHTDTLAFLDPYEVRSLNGFGGVIVNTLRNALGGESLGHGGTEWLNGGLGPDPQKDIQEYRGEGGGGGGGDDAVPPTTASAPPSLPVSLCRKAFSATQFNDLFGTRLGSRLWSLLHGRDDEPVIPAPPYPLQISIEDTFRNLRGVAVFEQIHLLAGNLLRRLEAELVDGDGDESAAAEEYNVTHEAIVLPAGGEEISTTTKVRSYTEATPHGGVPPTRPRIFKRFPLSVRLSIRQGWDNRVSKQTRMPVEIFDLTKSRATRATSLTATLGSLYRAMIQQYGDKGQGLNLINIAALDLAATKPAAALETFFGSGAAKGQQQQSKKDAEYGGAIDLDMLRELPEDIRREVAKQYGVNLAQVAVDVVKPKPSLPAASTSSSSSLLPPPPPPPSSLICPACGTEQEPWLQHDHSMWPMRGVAPCFVSGDNYNARAAAAAGDLEVDHRADDPNDPDTLFTSSQQGA